MTYLSSMDTIVASLADQLRPVLQKFAVRRAGVFGSYARGEATGESDVDLLVELAPGASLLDLVALQLELRDAVGFEVDVNTYRALHPLLRDQVLSEEIRIL
jgi:predicted nucleotidyltransferase